MKSRLTPVIAAILAAAVPGALFAQWATGSGGAIYYTGGNIGIGTASPQAILDIAPVGGSMGYFHATGAANNLYMELSNTGGNSFLGLESSAGGTLTVGGLPYATVLETQENSALHLGTGNAARLTILGTGNVGIGTTSPGAPLVVSSVVANNPLAYVTTSGSGGGFGLYNSNGNTGSRNWGIVSNYINYGDFSIVQSPTQGGNPFNYTGSNVLVYINATGNVGIGTSNPQHMLHVAGTIGAEQVIVSSTGADYVFDPSYALAPLSVVANYIEENHHLPGIPSAEEMTKHGVSIGDIQTKLLAKIEELTLHMIDMQRQNADLQQQVQDLRKQISAKEKP